MKLHTPVTAPNVSLELNHSKSMVCLGSCFAQEIGSRLELSLFKTEINPLGTIYNPMALFETIERACLCKEFQEKEFFKHLEIWRHFLIQEKYLSTDLEESINDNNSSLSRLGKSLKECSLLVVTFGSAWVYELENDETVIGFNHKLPISRFSKTLLKPELIVDRFKGVLETLKRINPELQICITVSPVRHLRDGLHENNISKSVLLLASHEIKKINDDIQYFPAYEILLDELRDYRFYGDDLSHPSQCAVDIIWERFSQFYLSADAQNLAKKITSIQSSLSHRPIHTDTVSYKDFKAKLKVQIDELFEQGLDVNILQSKFKDLP